MTAPNERRVVVRFGSHIRPKDGAWVFGPREDGDYVPYEDYAALEAKHKALVERDRLISQVLTHAPRMGDNADSPEGVRYIQISDTLASQLARALALGDE